MKTLTMQTLTREQRTVLDRMREVGKSWSARDLTGEERDAVDAWCKAHEHDMKHWRTSYIVCPHCLDEDREVSDYPTLTDDGDEAEMECAACEKTFAVELHIEYSYTTSVPEGDDDDAETPTSCCESCDDSGY